ncbi:hypothetical protein I4436_08840 [Pseudomonas qingdaonensis]|uniref:hypothetical protein n=1 Tax=Pseudomonas qingdaonensis TaxID=2056231 RepID=UPI0018C962FD|nr:hypothetical protein [Pseudomonas qingdaonensis]MBG8559721.1 hypothetical protein [Pseudomonas qingdaonensis]
MTRLALCLLLLATLAGCEPMTPEQLAQRRAARPDTHVEVMHDDYRQVTCWKYGGSNGGISCLPDWMLHRSDLAHNERQLSLHETQPETTPALAPRRWIDERYQL